MIWGHKVTKFEFPNGFIAKRGHKANTTRIFSICDLLHIL